MYKLKIQDDQGRSTRVPMLRDEISIGRDEGNTIRLTDRNVSRNHARLVQVETQLQLVDLSRYGTQVNGMRIKGEHTLEPHDVIQIGNYELSLEREGDLGLRPLVDDTSATLEGAPPPEEIALVEPARERARFGQAPTKQDRALRPRFMILSGAMAGTELTMKSDRASLGRSSEADLRINHRSISRIHAEISWDGQRCILHDTGSSNGVKVNGEDYSQSALRRGDVVELGHVRLRFLLPGEIFTFDPATMTHDIEARSRQTFRVFTTLVAAAVAMGIAWVTVFSQPNPTPRHSEPATETSKVQDQGVKELTSSKEAMAKAPRDLQEVLRIAKGHIKGERWAEAILLFSEALTIDATSIDAKTGLMHANNEVVAQSAYRSVSDLLKRGELAHARAEVDRLGAIGETSVYFPGATELRKAIDASLISELLDRGDAAMERRNYDAAIAVANEALALAPNNLGAASLRKRAEKGATRKEKKETRRRAEDQSAATSTERAKPKASPRVEPVSASANTGSMTAKDFYKAARKVHNSDPNEALQLYKKAASKGYARAWRQMGSLHLKQGSTAPAVKAYKRYLNLSPGASDAEVIRSTIIRLGGTP